MSDKITQIIVEENRIAFAGELIIVIQCEHEDYGEELKQKIESSLKLKELVKEWKDEIELDPSYENTTFTPLFDKIESLVDESNKTDKENGKEVKT